MAPAGTPPAVIARINDALLQALNDPKVAAQLDLAGRGAQGHVAGRFQVFLQAEIERWRKVVQTSGIKSWTEAARPGFRRRRAPKCRHDHDVFGQKSTEIRCLRRLRYIE